MSLGKKCVNKCKIVNNVFDESVRFKRATEKIKTTKNVLSSRNYFSRF